MCSIPKYWQCEMSKKAVQGIKFLKEFTISKTYIFVSYNIPEITLREENNKMC